MNTAYYMVSPPGTPQADEPLISFNPYLETNLIGTLSSEVSYKDSITWYGAFSNCMSCHRMAAWEQSTYIPSGNIDPANPVFVFYKYQNRFFMVDTYTCRKSCGEKRACIVIGKSKKS